MGIKQTDINSFNEPESEGFIHDTARSFLKRHSDPNFLLGQLKSLLAQGQIGPCCDMIQLIIRENHKLSDYASIYILRAQVAIEMGEEQGEVLAWLQQAQLCKKAVETLEPWNQLIEAKLALKEGDYNLGQKMLEVLSNFQDIGIYAKLELAQHLFWKNINVDRAITLLEDITFERPTFIKAWSCLGYAYNRIDEKEKAQESFGHCIELDSNPKRIEIYKQLIAS